MYFAMTAHLNLDPLVATMLDRPGLECAVTFLKPHTFTFGTWKIPDSMTLSASIQPGSPALAGDGFHGNSLSPPGSEASTLWEDQSKARKTKQPGWGMGQTGGWGGGGEGPADKPPSLPPAQH